MMPCYEPRQSYDDYYDLEKTLDARTADLCQVLNMLVNKDIYDSLPKHILSWHKAHQIWDRLVDSNIEDTMILNKLYQSEIEKAFNNDNIR